MTPNLTPNAKLPIEQIRKQGVSVDYYNALIGALARYRDWREGINGAIKSINSSPIKKYTERFPLSEYHEVITTLNREIVERLDSIAIELNASAKDGSLTDTQYRTLHTEACKLMFGPEREEYFGDGTTKSGGIGETITDSPSSNSLEFPPPPSL